jgi:hypothetical protein
MGPMAGYCCCDLARKATIEAGGRGEGWRGGTDSWGSMQISSFPESPTGRVWSLMVVAAAWAGHFCVNESVAAPTSARRK